MPCRKENYIFLEQSVTVDSKEVDALVTKIGEVLQLHNNSATQQSMSRLHSSSSSNSNITQTSATAQKRNGCCMRLRGGRNARSRASPYNIPGSSDQEWDSFATWKRKGLDVTGGEDDPHQLLQELILSGNLIKEAVRRIQFSSEAQRDFSKQID
ncbi:glycogen synthase kinase binding protein [Trichomycterus rosablanca]|uniref:glycogen synthase kinase binding protein n=1 Tax=Trichomycterus rosablanca TaxID=2290929 RepID=UPI002F353C00